MAVLRIGLLGASRVAVYAMLEPAATMADVEIVAVAARDRARAEAYALTHGIAHVEPDYPRLLSRDDLDLVYISTPPSVHAAQALAAVAAGKPALVEKPFALDAREARSVHLAARAAGVRVFEAMHSPHHRLFARILEILASGEIGRPRKIDAMFGAPIPADDALRWDASLGGGALMDLGVYPLTWIRRIAGEDFTVTSASQERGGGVDASFQATLTYANGPQCRAYASMTIEKPTARLFVEGDKGLLMAFNPLSPQLGHSLRIKVGQDERSETVEGPSSYAEQLSAIRATLLEGAPYPVPADDYVHAMAAVDKVRRACAEHKGMATPFDI